eukprot:scaffold2389_cov262-Pinguiococcus_pyrenoidosus.AAC.3
MPPTKEHFHASLALFCAGPRATQRSSRRSRLLRSLDTGDREYPASRAHLFVAQSPPTVFGVGSGPSSPLERRARHVPCVAPAQRPGASPRPEEQVEMVTTARRRARRGKEGGGQAAWDARVLAVLELFFLASSSSQRGSKQLGRGSGSWGVSGPSRIWNLAR